ncbi:MAG: riboflavin synthase, partial [Deltaproteobacteria bacterium]
SGKQFDVDVSPETLQRTTLGETRVGTRLNLERALRLSDRLDGHLVSGHIDGTGTLTHRKTTGNAIFIGFSVPESLARYMITKGSIAVDGVSLTINTCDARGFEVCIIPHTAQLTTIGQKKTGEKVNIETDIIGKYVERLLSAQQNNGDLKKTDPLDMQFLAKTGFL